MRLERQILLGTCAVTTLLIVLYAVLPIEERSSITSPRLQNAAVMLNKPRLTIPSIDVDAEIESLGLTPAGAMDTPEGPDNVGWYSFGVRPGEIGSAVIGGHRGWKNGEPAVFDDLGTLKKGDSVIVNDPYGTYTFIVRETRLYDKDAIAPEVFSSSDGVHLNLITCVGVWNEELKSSEERLVVFADLSP